MKKHYRFKDERQRVMLDDNEQPTNKVAYLDGYQVRDRMLEGVMFGVQLDQDGKGMHLIVDDDDMKYLSQFNFDKLIDEVASYVENHADILSSSKNNSFSVDYCLDFAPENVNDLMTVGEHQKELNKKQSLGRQLRPQKAITVTEGIVSKLSMMEVLGIDANVVTPNELAAGFTVNSEKLAYFKYTKDKKIKPT